METVILIFHLIIVVTMVMVILLQRSSNDGLSGLGGGGSNPSALGQARGSSNPLTKATAILATLFVCTSLGLAYIANAKNESVLDSENGLMSSQIPEIEETTKVPFLLDENDAEISAPTEAEAQTKSAVERKTSDEPIIVPVAE
jgi:preprotein translocase subunit SecG